jgi:hypothetical protein
MIILLAEEREYCRISYLIKTKNPQIFSESAPFYESKKPDIKIGLGKLIFFVIN